MSVRTLPKRLRLYENFCMQLYTLNFLFVSAYAQLQLVTLLLQPSNH